MLLFLGAGASKPFGIPDMMKLTDTVITELKAKNINPWIIDRIRDKVESFGMNPDIEAVLTCIDALCDRDKGIRNAGPFAALSSHALKASELTLGQKKEYYRKLSVEIREIIRNHCFLPKDDRMIGEIILTYNNLFQTLSFGTSQNLYVFTTNYDCCFERYCSEKGLDFFDGFKLIRGAQIFEGMENPDKSWKICKLHGSSNYVITDRDVLVKTDTILKPNDRITTGRIVKESMVFPTSEKYFSRDPYFSLIRTLREELGKGIRGRGDKTIIIVGYSFRDYAINNAFYDASKKPAFRHKDIYLINPTAKKIIEKNIPELNKIIEPVNKRFEDINRNDFS